MRQMWTGRFPIVFAAFLLIPAWTGLTAAEGNAATLQVQGVLASGAGKLTPDVAPSLKPYANVLNRFNYGKYEDIGRGSGVLRTGRSTAIKVGSHTIEASLAEVGQRATKIRYTVKDSKGGSIGSNVMSLVPGQPVPVQIGDPKFPIILLFRVGR